MLYAIIVALFVVLVAVSMKWAKSARQLRESNSATQAAMVTISTMVTAEAALAQRWAAQQVAYEAGFKDGLIAAEKAATKAVVAGEPPVLAIRALRNTTK